MANRTKEYQIKINGITQATREVGQLDQATGKLQGTVEDLRFDQAFKVDLGNTVIQFENISQAVSELDDLAQGAAGKLQMMKDAGEENTEAFKKLEAQFEAFVSKSAELERARKYSDELKDSLSSMSRGLDMSVQAFESMIGIMQVGTGIASAFGASEEEAAEQMNKMVQLMGVLQGVQTIYNQAVQQGTFLNKANAAADKAIAAVLPSVASGTKAATVATRGFSLALKSIGIGLVLEAISLLIEYWDDLKDGLLESVPALKGVGNAFTEIKSVIAGVGVVLLNLITGPITTAINVFSKLFKGDLGGAAEEAKKGLKKTYNVFANFEKGYKKVKDDTRKADLQDTKKAESEKLKYKIDTLEAEKGSDAKYSREAQALYAQYFAAKMAMYDKDSEEYKQALLDKKNYDREVVENAKKVNIEALKTSNDYAKKLKEANKSIEDNKLQAMKDGFEKRKLELERQKLEEIKIATERGVKVQEVIDSINQKYSKLEYDLVLEHEDKIKEQINKVTDLVDNYEKELAVKNIDVAKDYIKNSFDSVIKEFNMQASRIQNNVDRTQNEWEEHIQKLVNEVTKSNELFGAPNQTVQNTGEEFDTLINNFEKVLKNIKNEYVKQIDIFNNEIDEIKSRKDFSIIDVEKIEKEKENFDELTKYLENHFKETLENVKKLKDNYGKTNSYGQNEYFFFLPSINLMNNALEREDAFYKESLDKEKQNYQDSMEVLYKAFKEKAITEDEYNEKALRLAEASMGKLSVITGEHYNNINKITEEGMKSRDEIVKAITKRDYADYNKFFEDLEDRIKDFNNANSVDLGSMELNKIASFGQGIASMNKFGDTIFEKVNEIRKKMAELKKLFNDGIIDEDTFTQTYASLNNLSKQYTLELVNIGGATKKTKEKIEESFKLGKITKETRDELLSFFESTKKSSTQWAKEIAEVFASATSMITQAFSSIADMQYNNAMAAIEKEKKLLDKQNEILSDKLNEAEDIYSEHNDNVFTLQEELLTARGDRQNYLIDKLGQEMNEREKAWAVEQKIQRQQENNEKKKQALEKRQEQVERKRRKQQKIIDIQMALANTALGVTSALALKPFTLALVMASLAAALGATQVATIAATKTYGNGGKLSGPSHKNGGIPVGNTGIEVEGSEYIINKRTTDKNESLLSFINSKKKKLNIDDFIEFYSGGGAKIANASRTKFEDGGRMKVPTINPRVVASYMPKDTKKYYVSVEEIEDVTNHMNQVKAIAYGKDDE